MLGYIVIAAWIVQLPTNPALGVFGLLSLAAAWLAANAFRMRTRLPAFRSTNWLVAAGAWTAMLIAIVVTAGLAALAPSTTYSGVGTGPASSPSQSEGAEANSPSPAASTSTPSPTLTPTPSPTSRPSPVSQPTPSSPPPVAFNYCGAPENPWHYNFCAGNAGKYIRNPNPDFCTYFNCIASFWQSQNGYVVECGDGAYSHAGGVSGACSRHSGVLRALWD